MKQNCFLLILSVSSFSDSFQKLLIKDGPIAQFDPSFSLVDCIAQFGNSNLDHPGLCDDLEQPINRLFAKWFYSLV
jgi:hypothetical protein